jgi:hypothetical protein
MATLKSSSGSHILGTQISYFQTCGASSFLIWYKDLEGTFKEFSLKGFWTTHEDTYDISHQIALLNTLLYIFRALWTTSHGTRCTKLPIGFQQSLAILPSSWLVNRATSLSWQFVVQGIWHMTLAMTMWKVSWRLPKIPISPKTTLDAFKQAFLT